MKDLIGVCCYICVFSPFVGLAGVVLGMEMNWRISFFIFLILIADAFATAFAAAVKRRIVE